MASKGDDDGQRIEDLWGQLDRTHLDERDTELHRSSVPAHGVRKGASRVAKLVRRRSQVIRQAIAPGAPVAGARKAPRSGSAAAGPQLRSGGVSRSTLVYLLDGSSYPVHYTASSQVRLACISMKNKLGLENDDEFTLFAQTDMGTHLLDDNDVLAEVVSEPNFKSLLFQRYVYFPGGPTEQAELAATDHNEAAHFLAYIDACYHLREGHYRTDLKTACTLAALQMQSTYGDCGWEPEWPKDAHIKHMMAPSTWKGKDSAKHVKRQIMAKWSEVRGATRLEVERNLLEMVKKLPTYGASFFDAHCHWRPTHSSADEFIAVEDPTEVDADSAVVGIGHNGVHLLTDLLTDSVESYDYASVVKWTVSTGGSSFAMQIDEVQQLYLISDDAHYICSLVELYVQRLAQMMEQRESEEGEKEKEERQKREAAERLRKERELQREKAKSRRDSKTKEELPYGWESRLDPNTKRVYYYCSQLRRTQWEKPTAVDALPRPTPARRSSMRMAKLAQLRSKAPAAAGAASEYVQGAAQRTERVRRESMGIIELGEAEAATAGGGKAATKAPAPAAETAGSSKAAKPAAAAPAKEKKKEQKKEELPNGWESRLDPNTKRVYYYCSRLRRTQWEKPTAADALPQAEGGKAGAASSPAAAAKPKAAAQAEDDWQAHKDPNSGKTYFYSPKRRKSVWRKPDGEAEGGGKAASKAGNGSGAAAPAPSRAGAAAAGPRKKRGVIMGDSFEPAEEYVKKSFPKSAASQEVIRAALKKHFLFSTLPREQLEEVVAAMHEKRVAAAEVIIRQGAKGDNFYVVEAGEFDIFVNDNKVATVKDGASFGELALLHGAPRAATVKATQPCRVWALDRVTFRHMLAHNSAEQIQESKDTLRRVPLLESLTESQLDRVAEAVRVQEFPRGHRIIHKGDAGDVFYFIKSGTVLCRDVGRGQRLEDVPLHAGSYFGERALLLDEPRAANVDAETEVQCMCLDRHAFNELLGPLRELLDFNLGVRVLKSVPLLKALTDRQREKLVRAFRSTSYEDGQRIIEQGAQGDTFFVIKNGTALVSVDGAEPFATLSAGDFFGEMALLKNQPRQADVVAKDRVDCFVLSRDQFTQLLGPLQDLLSKSAETRRRELSTQKKEEEAATPDRRRRLSSFSDSSTWVMPTLPKGDDVRFEDLEQIKTLGTGTFGRVKLVRHRPTGQAFALKCLQKQQVVEFQQTKAIINEKKVMEAAQHPFILQLVATFQDTNSLFMLLELVQGGELFTLLTNLGGVIPVPHARFYTGAVLSALAYLHDKSILYRDLKPENLLLDSGGYMKVVDFGFAKVVKDRTYTLCGTPEYLAPELVLGKGYHKGVDLWALGILVYEMLAGYSPFADHENADQMVICRNIVQAKLQFPAEIGDAVTQDLVKRLLTRDPTKRIGCLKGGADDIKQHKWFRNFDWDGLHARKLQAPWIPPIKDPFDTSNFDEYDEDDSVARYRGKQDWCREF